MKCFNSLFWLKIKLMTSWLHSCEFSYFLNNAEIGGVCFCLFVFGFWFSSIHFFTLTMLSEFPNASSIKKFQLCLIFETMIIHCFIQKLPNHYPIWFFSPNCPYLNIWKGKASNTQYNFHKCSKPQKRKRQGGKCKVDSSGSKWYKFEHFVIKSANYMYLHVITWVVFIPVVHSSLGLIEKWQHSMS